MLKFLHARAIQNLAFDFGGRHRFRAHSFNGQMFALFFPEVFDGTDKYASAEKKLLLGSRSALDPTENWGSPVLPVPKYER